MPSNFLYFQAMLATYRKYFIFFNNLNCVKKSVSPKSFPLFIPFDSPYPNSLEPKLTLGVFHNSLLFILRGQHDIHMERCKIPAQEYHS